MAEKSISQAVEFILSSENITTKDDLDKWCENQGRQKLYNCVQIMAPSKWETIKEPKASVRACYEHLLIGYKVFNPKGKGKAKGKAKSDISKKFTCMTPAGCIACCISMLNSSISLEEAHIMNETKKYELNL
jgi:hypothetical protein